MSYALDRFQPRVQSDKSLVESIKETANASLLSGRLADWAMRKRKQMQAQHSAEQSVKYLMKRLRARGADEVDVEDYVSPLRKILTKIFKFCAKKIFKYVVRPILRFAARVAMTVVRTVLTAIVDVLIVPLIEGIVALAIANPVTAVVGAVLLVGGASYWIWDKFFREQAAPPKVSTKDIDTRAQPEVEEEGAVPQTETEYVRRATPADIVSMQQTEEGAVAPVPSVPMTIAEAITAPAQFLKKQYKKMTKKEFTGFGNDVDAYIAEAAIKYKIDESVLRGFVKMEAGWTGAMSPTGAIGTGQFIQSTWDGLAATDKGKEIGMTKIGKRFRTSEDPRFDKRINTLATGLLASHNAEKLKDNKLPVTGENLYMMHNIGPGIMQVMLGKPASEATLKAMSLNGMTKNMSARDFLIYQKGRFNVAYEEANSKTVLANKNPQMQEGIAIAKKNPTVVPNDSTQASNGGPSAAGSVADKTIIKGKGKSLIGLG